MYKVMIVDDEPLIREGLATLIDWEAYGFQIVQTAKDGLDALDKVEALEPDLLIVDIRMPGMDGLQLIETIRNRNLNPKLLILSGYADFDYAKKAIKSRVEGYILKPVDEDELIEYLASIKRALDREQEEAKQFSSVTRRSCETLIQSVLTGGGSYKGSMSSRASELGLIWKQYQVLLLLVQFDNAHQVDVLSKARENLESWIEGQELGVVFMRDLQIGILLRGQYTTNSQLERLYKELGEALGDLELTYYAAIGRTVYRFVDIKVSYDEAFELLKRKFFATSGRILSMESSPELKSMIESEKPEGEFDAEPYADRLYLALDVANKESIRETLLSMKQEMMRYDLSEQAVKTATVQMLSSVAGKLLQHHGELHHAHQDSASWIVDFYRYESISEMFASIEDKLCQLVDRFGSMNNETLVKRMIDLIHRNYDENLKLETLADIFNYNSAYLGKMFKSQTGEYFNTYLDKVRIEKAKQLLEEGLKVYQVAERVGYTNVDYFHSKFKKYTGVSPSAYRSKNISTQN